MEYFYFKDNKYFYFVDSNRIVNGGMKNLFLEYASNKRIEWEDLPVNEDILKSRVRHLKQIIFESTQDCTLRCLYCTYGGSYLHQRKNSSKYLRFDTARKTIDYLSEVFDKRPRNELTIGFYGGEPLINFDVIEHIVDYSKKVFPKWVLHFTITTNGTLLDERMIRFLVKNNFSLMVSLDGSGENHDAKRIFPDGRGSYDIVMENMKKIQDLDNDYYHARVSYFVTYSKDLPIAEVYRFFLTDERVNKNTVNLNFVNHLHTDYYNRYPYDAARVNTQMDEILKTISDKKIRGMPLAPVEEELLNPIIDLYKKTQRRRLSFLSGTCLFDNRLYVDADGVFHICEKMNQRFPLGDCRQGFDYSKMKEIVLEFINLIKQKCIDCEARFLCSPCYIHFAGDGKLEIAPEFCGMNKRTVKKLEKMIELKELGVLS